MAPANLDRYSRQVLFSGIGEEGQRHLLESSVLIAGCGALGTVLANNLARAGVGKLIIVDRDYIELNNLQRQVLFNEDHIARGLPKAIAAVETLRQVNSEITLVPVVADVNPGNVEELVAGADLVLDGTDNFETRYLINDVCVKTGKPWIYSGVIGSYGVTMNIRPGQGPCLRCIFSEMAPPGTSPTCDTAGVLNSVVGIITGFASAEAIKILLGSSAVSKAMLWVDVWDNTLDRIELSRMPDECLTCGKHIYEFLEARGGTHATSLCGRSAVQVSTMSGSKVSFPALAQRLEAVGKVSFNEFILRFKVDPYEFTVFRDARAIIKGTTDETVARTLYAKYIGA